MSKKRVLIVEDDIWQGDLYLFLLKHDYTALRVTSAEAAMEAIDSFQPDSILLDVLLDGANGITLLHELQSHDDTARIPVILCTSLEHMHKNSQILAHYGVKQVLDKATITPQKIRAAVNGVVI
ncbi:MAG TPA: response regulator [Verrucomicrobiae bacterium]|nr:response regulator [Verrucomicrobiae bacterium]